MIKLISSVMKQAANLTANAETMTQ